MKIKVTKKYTTRFKKMAFGGDPEGEVLAVHSIFNDKGNVIEEIRIDEDDQIEKHQFVYNDAGKLIQHDLLIESDGISEMFVYERDEKGRILKETKFYGEEEGERTIYEYSSHEQPVSIERFDADNEPESFDTITYNDKDLLTEHRRFNNEKKLIEISQLSYNDKNLPIEKRVLNEKSDIVSITTLVYNDKDELIRMTEKNKEGKTTSDIISVYDDRSNVIERRIRDFHSRSLQFVYDERDNCVEEAVYDEHGNMTMKSNYEFDEKNNPIAESGYFLDMNRGSQMANSQSRYEYEYWTPEHSDK